MSDENFNKFESLLNKQFLEKMKEIRKTPEDLRPSLFQMSMEFESKTSGAILTTYEDYSDERLDEVIDSIQDIINQDNIDNEVTGFFNVGKGDA